MPDYTERDLQEAIEAVLDGRSLRRAAQLHGVPRQTLADRILEWKTKSDANNSNQRLSPEAETKLVSWIIAQGALGYLPRILRCGASFNESFETAAI